MIHEEQTLTTEAGAELFSQRWVPNGRPRAALALLHGWGEHSGRFLHVGEALAREGYALCAVDFPGHGRTKGKRGDGSRDRFLEALDALLLSARTRFPGVPVFLYGASMGGAIALIHAMTRPQAATGVIVTSPLIRLAGPAPALKVAAARLLSRALPGLIMSNPLDLALLSRDPAVADAAARDPLYHNKVSAKLGWDIIAWGDWFGTQGGSFPLPLLVMIGSDDRIVDPSATIALAGRLTGDVTLKRWDGMYHELHNEPQKREVLAFMMAWMRRHGA
jgi:acylglycerol lipase